MPPEKPSKLLCHQLLTRRLLEGVGAGTPIGEEQAEADGLENTGKTADKDGVKRALLSEDLGDDLEGISIKISYDTSEYNIPMAQQKRRRSESRGRQRPCM